MAKFFTPTKLSENIRETPEGFLVCLSVPIGRTGEMIYGEEETPLEGDSTGRVLIERDSTDLFHPRTLASFEGKAVTIGHPIDFVGPHNWADLAKGVVQNVRKSDVSDDEGEESLIADLLITDAIAIGLIKKGLREVSCGYEAIYEQTGEGRGKQVDIIGNHLALVEQGRAGPYYAINDHKKERLSMKNWKEKAKAYFSKAIDEAPEAMDAEMEKKEEKAADMGAYDELVKIVKDLGEKIEAMGKPKDAEMEKKEEKPKDEKEENKEEQKDEEVAASVEERLKAIEMAVAKLMEMESKEAEEMGDEDEDAEEMGDEDPAIVGDTKARAEILAPGIQMGKDVKAKALKAAYGTKEGKAVIDALTGNKGVAFDSVEKVSELFLSASEVLKVKRGSGLGQTRKSFEVADSPKGAITADQLNQMNKAFWSRK